MTASDVLPYFQLASAAGIVVGAFFAGYQLWRGEQHRKAAAALATVTSFNTSEFRNAFAKVYSLPLGADAKQVRDAGRDMEDAATAVMMTFEMIGVLVYNRMVPIETVDQAIGGFLRESWRRLEKYVAVKRVEVQSPRWGEWYQWLFEHLAVNPRRAEGAYQTFKDWRP
ncbi:MAG: hypothetical protein V4510_06715 [bacterium]